MAVHGMDQDTVWWTQSVESVAERFKGFHETSRTWTSVGKWLRFGQVTYSQHGRSEAFPAWETVERTTRRGLVDGVEILALASSSSLSGKHLVLVINYRPPVGAAVLEFPAGLVDEKETPEQAAVRELFEETGLKGQLIEEEESTKQHYFYNPSMSNDAGRLIHMRVNLDAAENVKAQPKPEPNEAVQPVLVPLAGLAERLSHLQSNNFIKVDSRVFMFAQGLQLAQRLASI